MAYDPDRLDRQLRIEGWDQDALADATVGVIGDTTQRDATYILSAAALGVNDIIAVSPVLPDHLMEAAEQVNPFFELDHVEGHLTHPSIRGYIEEVDLLVDCSSYNLANKSAFNHGYSQDVPVIRSTYDEDGAQVYSYTPGDETVQIERMLADAVFPGQHDVYDPVLDMVTAGIALEETANLLMDRDSSDAVIEYESPYSGTMDDRWSARRTDWEEVYGLVERRDRSELNAMFDRMRGYEEGDAGEETVLVVGAGGLGNFVGPALASSGVADITFLDPDEADETNLNRQVFLYDAVGENKAETLAQRVNDHFDAHAEAVDDYFTEDLDISGYDAVFDCVDNFETRILLSEAAEEQGVPLISGGTGIDAGQVVPYQPDINDETPADVLGLYSQVETEDITVEDIEDEEGESCVYQPDPSVIMTNEIIGGLMVDAYRTLQEGGTPQTIFYDSTSDHRL